MSMDATTDTTTLPALLDEIVELEAQRAGVEAAIERAMARLGDRVDAAVRALPPDRQAAQVPVRDVSARLAARLRVSDRTVQSRMAEAQTLVAEFPALVEAWSTGRVTRGHVRAITDAGERLRDPETRATFEAHLLRVAEDESVARTRPVAELMAERLNPIPLAERHAQARARRKAQLRMRPDAMARVLLDVPAVLGRGIFERATQLAELERHAFDGTVLTALADKRSLFEVAVTLSAGERTVDVPVGGVDVVLVDHGAADHDAASRDSGAGSGDSGDGTGAPATGAAGDPGPSRMTPAGPRPVDHRTLDQRRADILAELLLTGIPTGADPEACAKITAHVRITVPVMTLVGDDIDPGRAPAELAGRTPVDPATARRLVAEATGWDRVLTHPVTGMVLAVDRYRPTEAQRRYLDARDLRCRFPGCTQPSHRCDNDHTIEYSRGGPTDVRYLASECKRHHPLRHASEWIIIARADGVFDWIDPDGRHYRDRPAPTVGFLPDDFFDAQHRRDGLHFQPHHSRAPF